MLMNLCKSVFIDRQEHLPYLPDGIILRERLSAVLLRLYGRNCFALTNHPFS